MRLPFRSSAVLLVAVVLGCDSGSSGGFPIPPPSPEGTAPPPRPVAPRVFAVLVTDTQARAAARGFTLDVERNAAAVRQMLAGVLGPGRLEIVELSGAKVRPAELEATIRALPIGPEDAIVCYVTGHGTQANQEDADGFRFFLHGANPAEALPRVMLRQWLTDKKPRLAVLLSDTSAGVPGAGVGPLPTSGTLGLRGVPADIPADLFVPLSDREAVAPVAAALFFTSSGVVDLSGAGDGASGWGPPGEAGFFTRSLVGAVHESRANPAVDWPSLYARVRSAARDGYRSWWAAEIRRIREKPQPPPRPDQDTTRGLLTQPEQAAQAYFVPGSALNVLVEENGRKDGIQVGNLALDSPGRKAGVKVGDRVLRVEGTDTTTTEDWDRVVSAAFQAGAKKLAVRLRGPDGGERDVSIELTPGKTPPGG